MKKLTIAIAALSLGLNFASCNKEDEVANQLDTFKCPEFTYGEKCQFETRHKYYGYYAGVFVDLNTGDEDTWTIAVKSGDEYLNTLTGYQSKWTFDKDGNIFIAKQKRESVSDGIEGTGMFKGDSLILNIKYYDEATDLNPETELVFKGKRN